MQLEVIELTLDDLDLDRVEAIAFVDTPAIQRDWMAFSKQKARFQVQDEEKRIVAGALMVADMPIYRNMDGQEFYVKFSGKTIEDIVNKFMKEGRINAFNFMHNENDKLEGVYLQQSFLIDSTKGINPPTGYPELADGSWFGFVKVDNDKIWQEYIKTGMLKGFSVEGTFSEKRKFNTNNIMTKVEEFLSRLEKKFFSGEAPIAPVAPIETVDAAQAELGSKKLTDGTEIKYEGELAEGVAVTLADGSPAPDGEHTFEDGTVIAVSGGVIAAIKMPEAAPAVDEQMKAEINALKLENEELKKQIAGAVTSAQMQSEIAKINETAKEMFSLIKAVAEAKDETAKKDKFKKAELALNDKVAAMAQRLASEGVLQK